MLDATVINNVDRLTEIRDDWKNLYIECDSGNFFVSWEWISTWWEHYGRDNELYVILVKEYGKLVGIAPLMIIKETKKNISMKCLSFIGQSGSGLCPDHLDIISLSGYEKAVADCICESVLSKGKWDKISFSGVAEDSFFYEKLVTALQGLKIGYYEGISSVSPYAKLPTVKYEKKWKYYQRRLSSNYNVRFEYHSAKNDLTVALNIVKNLILASAKRNNRSSDWSLDNYYGFHQDLGKSVSDGSIIGIAVLYCNDTPVSVLYGFIDKGKFMLYSTGFDTDYASYSVGHVLIGMFCNYLVENDLAVEFDFLRGDEDYKYRWTELERRDRFVYFYGSNLKGHVVNGLERFYRSYQKLINSNDK